MTFSRGIAIAAAGGAALMAGGTFIQAVNPKIAAYALMAAVMIIAFCERVQGGKSKPKPSTPSESKRGGVGRGLTLSLAVFTLLFASVAQTACGTTELQRAKSFSARAVTAVSQGPNVVQVLVEAHVITANDGDFYKGILNAVTDSLHGTDAEIQVLTRESTHSDALKIALRGSQDLISRLLARIEPRTDVARDRVQTILTLVRGFMFAVSAYLNSSSFAKIIHPLNLKESELARLEKLCDPHQVISPGGPNGSAAAE